MNDGVSVIIPTYNRAGLIGRAIKSVLAATSLGDEILVIDDGSTDDTAAVVRSFGDAVRYHRTENAGAGAARNLGIRLAERPLVAFLDSDDEWLPDKLQLQRKFMEKHPHAVFCFGNLRAENANGEIVHDLLSLWRSMRTVGWADSNGDLGESLGPAVPFSSITDLPHSRSDFDTYIGDLYPILMEVGYVASQTAMIRHALAGESFRYAEDVRVFEEWECFAQLSRLGPAAFFDCELAVMHNDASSRLTDADDLMRTIARIMLLQRIWGASEQFLRTHSARYRSLSRAQHLRRARLLIGEVRLKEAKLDLEAADAPLTHRLIARLPPVVVRTMLGVKRRVSRLLKAE